MTILTSCLSKENSSKYPSSLGKFQARTNIGKPQILTVHGSNDNDEGSYFAVNAASPQDISTFMQNNYPKLSNANTDAINQQYPLSQNPPVPAHNTYFHAAYNAYGETTFNCPGLLITRSFAHYGESKSTWSYRYNVVDPANIAQGLGVPHTFEVPAVWGVNSNAGGIESAYQTTNAPDVPLVMDYWLSFVLALNPNTYKEAGAPTWETVGIPQNQRRLLIEGAGKAGMESVAEDQKARCQFWEGLAITMEQ